jgi:hypothetical protein
MLCIAVGNREAWRGRMVRSYVVESGFGFFLVLASQKFGFMEAEVVNGLTPRGTR